MDRFLALGKPILEENCEKKHIELSKILVLGSKTM
jgi:hypothetical protein